MKIENDAAFADLSKQIDDLKSSLEKVQGIAKRAMDNLPAKWQAGYQAGMKAANANWEEGWKFGHEQKRIRDEENFTFTAEIMKLELEIERLKNGR
jgi:hypothetical protein